MAVDLYSLVFVSFAQIFYKYTVAVETLGVIVALMISYLGYRGYKVTNHKKYLYFFWGFLFLALNFGAHIILNLMLRLGYAKFLVEQKYNLFILPLFGIYYFFLIAALLAYISFAILYLKPKGKRNVWLFYGWTFVLGALSYNQYLVFNVLAAVPLSFVSLKLLEKYKETKQKPMLFTLLGFTCLFLFHILVLFEVVSNVFFTIRYSILLVGLLLLLTTLVRIFNARKKK